MHRGTKTESEGLGYERSDQQVQNAFATLAEYIAWNERFLCCKQVPGVLLHLRCMLPMKAVNKRIYPSGLTIVLFSFANRIYWYGQWCVSVIECETYLKHVKEWGYGCDF